MVSKMQLKIVGSLVNIYISVPLLIKSSTVVVQWHVLNINVNAAKRINNLQFRLNKAMASTLWFERRRISGLQRDLAAAYRDEEVYWKLKSRNQWMKEGYRNTKFFQACVKNRFAQNLITTIKDDCDNVYSGDSEIGTHTELYFTQVYTSTRHKVSLMEFADFNPTVSSEINVDLTREFTTEEIYAAV
ncbi:unnamed protein product [Arabidopsis halleri]